MFLRKRDATGKTTNPELLCKPEVRKVGRDPNLGRGAFHSGSRNNFQLNFKFAVLIRHNKCTHLMFCVLSFIQFWARKLLLSAVVLLVFSLQESPNNCKVFSTKLYAQEIFGQREFRTI